MTPSQEEELRAKYFALIDRYVQVSEQLPEPESLATLPAKARKRVKRVLTMLDQIRAEMDQISEIVNGRLPN